MPLFNLDFYRFSQRYSPRTLLFYTFQLTQAKIKGSMRATSRLLQSCRITFFTRQNCGLCVQARSVLADVWDKRQFAAKEIDIIKPESKGWRDLYEFDVPVVCPSLLCYPCLGTRSSKGTDTYQQGSESGRRSQAVLKSHQADASFHPGGGPSQDGCC